MERGERATVQEQEEQVSECAGGDVRWKNDVQFVDASCAFQQHIH